MLAVTRDSGIFACRKDMVQKHTYKHLEGLDVCTCGLNRCLVRCYMYVNSAGSGEAAPDPSLFKHAIIAIVTCADLYVFFCHHLK